jgi:hypothetical protein
MAMDLVDLVLSGCRRHWSSSGLMINSSVFSGDSWKRSSVSPRCAASAEEETVASENGEAAGCLCGELGRRHGHAQEEAAQVGAVAA